MATSRSNDMLMISPIVYDDDEESGDEDSETTEPVAEMSEEAQARKKVKESPLHENFVAPLSFLINAVGQGQGASFNFNITHVNGPFGRNDEAYVRSCYEKMYKKIIATRKNNRKKLKRSMVFIITGSSGIGKSTFLAYFVARGRAVFRNIAIFYASKNSKSTTGEPRVEETRCVLFVNDRQVFDGQYAQYDHVRICLEENLPSLDLIVMDGCSMPFDLAEFKGTVVVAASPSLFVKNLKDAMIDHYTLIMPPLEDQEALAIGKMLGVEEHVVLDNLGYMKGITRYLFELGAAQRKVKEAVAEVNASSITKMVSMQSSNRAENNVTVHSLVLWKAGEDFTDTPTFDLVSRYAENLVAKKLALETIARLKSAREDMAPLSGAEGYAGALFEAYAIRKLQGGGSFEARSLDDASTSPITITIPRMTTTQIVVVENNKLTASVVPYADVRVLETSPAHYSPRLLWPTTTNFPTFDCFYFHTNGTVFPLQMTIALIHPLKNSGAANAKNYFDGMFRRENIKPEKYRAVFVVPSEMADIYTSQVFKGDVEKRKEDVGQYFEQWVIGV
jgi:hypothetical protein